MFHEDYTPEHVNSAVATMRDNLGVEAIDMVQVVWWDFKVHNSSPDYFRILISCQTFHLQY